MKNTSVLSLVALIPAALAALPNDIVAKPLPEGCASYPGYNPDTDIAGPWVITVGMDAENPAIRGFGDTDVYSVAFDGRRPSLRWGHVSPTLVCRVV
jgi:hypothetical protein